ncbi:MAG: helix-turn-helix transcriptional regulator, partial [Silvanigrellaceae bacterium]|nr:helix-turn-helix transcriptional regulator [Silvanigrellaceae bacterium]
KNKKEEKMHDERSKSFAIPPGISLINEADSFIDTYSFSSSLIFQDRINILLNESNKLYKFGVDFSKNFNEIILEHTKKDILDIDNNSIKPIFPSKMPVMSASSISRQYTDSKIFTKRQVECIYCAAQGLNSAQTGDLLNISKRTVESILNGAILKLGCVNKYQLIYQSTKYGLILDDLVSPKIKENIAIEILSRL